MSTSATDVSARPTIVLEQPSADPAGAAADSTPTVIASNASVSGNGRYYVAQGIPPASDPAADPGSATACPQRAGERRPIYFTDRETNATMELTPVPPGVRTGNSIHPVISGDGCSVAIVTELPLDVFRDDDTGERWDVYRARLPLCGGEFGGWELVSTRTDGSTLARDDVSIVDHAGDEPQRVDHRLHASGRPHHRRRRADDGQRRRRHGADRRRPSGRSSSPAHRSPARTPRSSIADSISRPCRATAASSRSARTPRRPTRSRDGGAGSSPAVPRPARSSRGIATNSTPSSR